MRNHRRSTVSCLVLIILCLGWAAHASAANYYVRSGASGNNSGADWVNAWRDFASIKWATVSCGDTIWVAGGTYSGTLAPTKKCTSGAPLSVRRARADATSCTTAAGWNDAYSATVHQANGSIIFNGDYDYITISGRTNAAGGSNGWLLDRSGTTGGCGVCFDVGGADHNTVEYMDLQGPGNINYTSDGRAIDETPSSGSTTYNTFSHLKIWEWESGIYTAGINTTIEHVEMFDIHPLNWSAYHPNGIMICCGAANGIVRYSRFYKGPNGYGVGEGIYFASFGGSTNGWQVYGNVFHDLDYSGLKAIEIENASMSVKIWNNVFDNIITGPIYFPGGSCSSGSEYKNNLSFTGSTTCGASSNNLVTTNSSVVVGRAAKDYHIVSTVASGFPRNAGVDLSANFTADMDGMPFGGDGAWDIGAYSFGTGGAKDARPGQPSAIQLH